MHHIEIFILIKKIKSNPFKSNVLKEIGNFFFFFLIIRLIERYILLLLDLEILFLFFLLFF